MEESASVTHADNIVPHDSHTFKHGDTRTLCSRAVAGHAANS